MNEAKLHEFMGKLVTDMGGAAMMAMVIVGEELGLYRAMADGKPVTADALATRSGCHPRLVREWLDANAASGYVEHDRRRLPAAARAGHGARQRGLAGVRGARRRASSRRCFMDLDKLVPAMRATARSRGAITIRACSTASRGSSARATTRTSSTTWLPALDGVVEKLERGAKVADVGCGHGASTIVMAKAYPKSRFVGIDFHEPSIETARPARGRRRRGRTA